MTGSNDSFIYGASKELRNQIVSKQIKYVKLKLFMSESELKAAETLKFNLECDGFNLVESRPSYLKYEK